MTNVLAALDYWQFGPWTPIDGLPWLQVHSFGTLVAIGLITCLTLASWRAEKKLGISGEEVQNVGIWLIVVGWIFAHVFNVLFYEPEKVLEDPLILLKVWGSISSYGGLLGGIIGIWLWKKWHPKFDVGLWADHGAWGLTFAWFFGRVGCASVHDHPGAIAPETWFLAIQFPDGTIRHDLGFYEAIWWFVICIVVLWLDRKPRPKGFFLGLVPLMYAPARFVFDFMRVWPAEDIAEASANPIVPLFLDLLNVQAQQYDYGSDLRAFGFTPAQWMSIGLFIFGVIQLWRIRNRPPLEWKEYKHPEDSAKSTK